MASVADLGVVWSHFLSNKIKGNDFTDKVLKNVLSHSFRKERDELKIVTPSGFTSFYIVLCENIF